MARGSVQRVQGKRGVSYRVRVELSPDPATGKRRWHSEMTRTKREAEARVADLVARVEGGTYDRPSRETLGVFLVEEWLPWYRTHVRASSAMQRQSHVTCHLLPQLGHVRLSDLRAHHARDLYRRLGDTHSRNTLRAVHSTFSTALNRAVEWGYLSSNPIAGCSPPKAEPREATLWGGDQLHDFLATIEDETLRMLCLTIALTGMRRGEALALRWRDLDLERGALQVAATVTRVVGGERVGPPKTSRGRRRLILHPELVDALRAFKTRQEAHYARFGNAGEEWVFAKPDGTRLSGRTTQRHWQRALARTEVHPIRIHDLRHGVATTMLGAGVPLKIVSEYLGHGSIRTTADTYQHVTEEMSRLAADSLGALIQRREDGKGEGKEHGARDEGGDGAVRPIDNVDARE